MDTRCKSKLQHNRDKIITIFNYSYIWNQHRFWIISFDVNQNVLMTFHMQKEETKNLIVDPTHE